MTDPQLLPDFQAQLENTRWLRHTIQTRLDLLTPMHEKSKTAFAFEMLRMGPKSRANAQFTIQANERSLAEMQEQLATCDTQIRLLEMCINAVKHMENQRAEQSSLSRILPSDPDGVPPIA